MALIDNKQNWNKNLLAKIFWLLSLLSFLVLFLGRYFIGYWLDIMFLPIIMGISCFITAFVLDYKNLKNIFLSKKTHYSSNLLFQFLCVLCSFVFLNILLAKYNLSWDLSHDKIHTLSPMSQNVLNSLDENLEIKAFFSEKEEQEKNRFDWLMQIYTKHSSRIKLTYYEPKTRPDLVEQYKIDPNDKGSVIFLYKGKQTRLKESHLAEQFGTSQFTEQNITNAIVKIKNEKSKKIYFLTGHSERSLEANDAESISQFSKSLQEAGYDVRSLRILELGKIPSSASVLVIAGSQKSLLQQELLQIKDFLEKGGSLFLAADPNQQHNLAQVTKILGIEFQNNFILDIQGQKLANNAVLSVGSIYNAQHFITQNIPVSEYTLFSYASALQKAPDALEYYNIQSLVRSGEESFTQNKLQVDAVFNPKTDRKGPLDIIMISEGEMYRLKDPRNIESGVEKNKFKAVVAGDSDFFSNKFFTQVFNRDLSLNIIAYLADDMEQVSIRPKISNASVLYITDTNKTIYVMFHIAFSLILLFFAIYLWYKRRSL